MDVSGFAGVKGAMAIIDLELRCRSKQEITHGLEFAQCRKSDRHDSRAHDVGNSALGRREREDPIGGLNQTLGESDTLALIRVEEPLRCAAREYGFEFPGQIDGVANPGVHALPADRTMNVSRIAEQKRASFSEMLRDTMMNMIGRKPIYFFDIDLEILDDPAADILEVERVGAIGTIFTYCPDQPGAPLPGERKQDEEISRFEINVDITIECRAGCLDVSDIKEMIVGAARKPRANRLAHNRARAVASGNIGCFATLFATARPAQPRDDLSPLVAVPE
jgi:hypothetical protein